MIDTNNPTSRAPLQELTPEDLQHVGGGISSEYETDKPVSTGGTT